MRKLLILTALCALLQATASAQTAEDREGVRQAVLDYVESVYNAEPARIERSVHPELAKRGFYIKRGETAYSEGRMTFAELVELTKNWNKDRKDLSKAPKEIVIHEVLDQTASAKLVAAWGVDFMQLAKYNGKWMIVNIVWQTHPKKE